MTVLMLAVDRGRLTYRNFAIGLYAAAAVVIAICMVIAGWDFYRQSPMVVVVMLLAMAAFYHRWYASLSWDRNFVLVTLRDHPHAITSASVMENQGLAALLNERQVVIEASGHEIMLTFKVADLPLLGSVLQEYCSNITLRGFP
jgi:hypothetical protein